MRPMSSFIRVLVILETAISFCRRSSTRLLNVDDARSSELLSLSMQQMLDYMKSQPCHIVISQKFMSCTNHKSLMLHIMRCHFRTELSMVCLTVCFTDS
ncbi:hypothetical protein EV424DRAFT_172911 [Suillus variegatus]|nr:hypothetical protein EV424DRAFT_172911 [Suillus variegatus]